MKKHGDSAATLSPVIKYSNPEGENRYPPPAYSIDQLSVPIDCG